jgi:dihydrofolate reductase
MTKLRVHAFSISLDGYGAGPNQDMQQPLGVGGEHLHDWFVATRTFRATHGDETGGTTGVDDDFAARGVAKAGGTTFHFVAEGIHAALERAKAAARGRDVRVGGGAATIRQYLRAGLIDEMHVAIAPILLGSGEHCSTGSTS